MRRLELCATILATALWACGSDEGGGDGAGEGPDAGPGATVTWYQDIAPLVAQHCTGCHTDGGIAPFSLEEYEMAAPLAPLMVAKVKAGEMPPWDAVGTDDCNPRFGWREDPRLSPDEVALLEAWSDQGAPEGDPDSAAPLPDPPPTELVDATHRIAPATGFSTSGDTDQFICFVLDPGIAEQSWVTGVHMVPSNLEVAHHAVATVVPPQGQAQLEQLAGPDGIYECFGGVNVPGAYFLGVWVPGSLPFQAPEDVGIPLPANSKIVVQLHYHPAGKTHEPDVTELQIRVTDQQPDKQLVITAIGNAPGEPFLLPGPNDNGAVEFRIPAGVADHTETMRFPVELPTQQRFPIVSAFPHMHYVGVDLEVRISRGSPGPGEPAEECLLKVPTWDFEWQRTYLYDAPLDQLPTVGDGDLLTIRCRYDNSLENPFVMRALQEAGLDAPVDVFLGEQTLDEMCLAAFGIILD